LDSSFDLHGASDVRSADFMPMLVRHDRSLYLAGLYSLAVDDEGHIDAAGTDIVQGLPDEAAL
jgi:hypothetical protein